MTTATERPPLLRSRLAVVGGVSDGLALHLGWQPRSVRILFVALSFASGAGVLLYLWLWALVPLPEGDEPVTRSAPVALIAIAGAGVSTMVVLAIAGQDAVLGWLVAVAATASVAVIWELASTAPTAPVQRPTGSACASPRSACCSSPASPHCSAAPRRSPRSSASP